MSGVCNFISLSEIVQHFTQKSDSQPHSELGGHNTFAKSVCRDRGRDDMLIE